MELTDLERGFILNQIAVFIDARNLQSVAEACGFMVVIESLALIATQSEVIEIITAQIGDKADSFTVKYLDIRKGINNMPDKGLKTTLIEKSAAIEKLIYQENQALIKIARNCSFHGFNLMVKNRPVLDNLSPVEFSNYQV